MARYHVAHIFPDMRVHILNGYNDVIRSVMWGLAHLGHEVSYGVNEYQADARNIAFGASWLHPRNTDHLPDDTIVYNLEQVETLLGMKRYERVFRNLANRFEIWDYSQRNIACWKKLNPAVRIRYLPIGYAPVLTFDQTGINQDIDVLFYGGTSQKRLAVFKELCKMNLCAMYVSGIYGESRDALIARSKVVMNVHQPNAEIFSIVRVSYLLANRKLVMSDLPAGMEVEQEILPAVVIRPTNELANICWQIVRQHDIRRQQEEQAFAIMESRDIRTYLLAIL